MRAISASSESRSFSDMDILIFAQNSIASVFKIPRPATS